VAGYLDTYATKTATVDVSITSAHLRRLQTAITDLDLRARVAAPVTGNDEFKLLGH